MGSMKTEIEGSNSMNIYQRLSAITAEISAVAKNLLVGEGRNQYKAVGEADVLAAVRPVEAKYGVYSYPYSREIEETAILTSVSSYKGETKEVKKLFLRMKVIYRFVNMDNPADFIDVTTFGDGVDPQDKAPGKAMTYADKYALLKAYKIITGDDPDQKMSEELADKQKSERVARQTISEAKMKTLFSMCENDQVNPAYINKLFKVKDLSEMTEAQFKNCMDNWEKVKEGYGNESKDK